MGLATYVSLPFGDSGKRKSSVVMLVQNVQQHYTASAPCSYVPGGKRTYRSYIPANANARAAGLRMRSASGVSVTVYIETAAAGSKVLSNIETILTSRNARNAAPVIRGLCKQSSHCFWLTK